MAGINDLLKVAASAVKINRTDEVKKTSAAKTENSTTKTEQSQGRSDNAQISEAARELLTLRMDAKRHIDEVGQSETLNPNEVKNLKQKIENKYFVSDEVVDKIVDKLLDLPNFLVKNSKSL